MDIQEHYEELFQKLKSSLPVEAYPIKELVKIFRDKENPIHLKTALTITDVYNSGDISGIMCIVLIKEGNPIACALAHFIFSPDFHLYKEIVDYQKKREKRIRKLRNSGMN